jgi:hypothetical protein
VQRALDPGQPGEGGQGPPTDPLGQSRLGDDPLDVGVGPDHRGVLGADVEVRGRHPAPGHGVRLDPPAPHGQGGQLPLDQGQVGAGVDQAPERHVAGDAGEAVPPGHVGHRCTALIGAVSRSLGPSRRATA